MDVRRLAVTVDLRQATRDDVAGITQLVGHLGYPTDEAAMRARLDAIFAIPERLTLLATDGDALVGLAGGLLDRSYEFDGYVCRLTGLVVDPSHHGQGIGTLLLDAVENWAADHGAAMVTLNCGTWRDAAHCFYERRGYRLTGYRFRRDLR